MIVWYYLTYLIFLSLKLECMLLRVIGNFLFFFGYFIAYNESLLIFMCVACFMRFSMSTQDARLEVFKKQYQKITYLSLLKDR